MRDQGPGTHLRSRLATPLPARRISVRLQGQLFKITVILVNALTHNAEEAEVQWFYEDLLELTPKTDVLFIIGDWNAKVGSQETTEGTGKFGLGVQIVAGQRLGWTCSVSHCPKEDVGRPGPQGRGEDSARVFPQRSAHSEETKQPRPPALRHHLQPLQGSCGHLLLTPRGAGRDGRANETPSSPWPGPGRAPARDEPEVKWLTGALRDPSRFLVQKVAPGAPVRMGRARRLIPGRKEEFPVTCAL